MAEWSIAAVLKTVDCNRSGGSNPSSSAGSIERPRPQLGALFFRPPAIELVQVSQGPKKEGGARCALRSLD